MIIFQANVQCVVCGRGALVLPLGFSLTKSIHSPVPLSILLVGGFYGLPNSIWLMLSGA